MCSCGSADVLSAQDPKIYYAPISIEEEDLKTMPASSILVITDTAESVEFRLVHLLGGQDATSPFVLSCEECISTADAPRLLRTVLDHPPAWKALFEADNHDSGTTSGTSVTDGGSVGAFTLLVALLDRVPDPMEATMLGRELLDAVESYSGNETGDSGTLERKLGMLCALYNLRPSPKEKCWLLGRILALAGNSNLEELQLRLLPGRGTTLGTLLECKHLIGLVERDFVDVKAGEEGLDEGDRRVLYRIAAEVVGRLAALCRSKGDAMDKDAEVAEGVRQTYLLKLLETYSTVVSHGRLYFPMESNV